MPKLAQAPPHPINVEGAVALAVSVIGCPDVNSKVQVPDSTPADSVQLMASRSSVTAPMPVPSKLTVSAKLCVEPVTVSVVLESVALLKFASPA